MQTFLPYDNLEKSVKALDNKRLGKQRVECYQLISVISGRPRKDGKPYKGWTNHPITVMWRNHLNALKLYYNLCIDEWIKRGFKNTMEKEKIEGPIVYPEWFGYIPFHASHRSNLLRKDKSYYSKLGWSDSADWAYLWFDNERGWHST